MLLWERAGGSFKVVLTEQKAENRPCVNCNVMPQRQAQRLINM